MIRRREFIVLLGGAAAWPLPARAQQPERMRRVGVLMGYPEAQSEFASFMYELRKLGWMDGRNLRIDTRWGTPADPDSMHRFARELVALQPDKPPRDRRLEEAEEIGAVTAELLIQMTRARIASRSADLPPSQLKCGRNSAGSPEICAIFQRDILRRHF